MHWIFKHSNSSPRTAHWKGSPRGKHQLARCVLLALFRVALPRVFRGVTLTHRLCMSTFSDSINPPYYLGHPRLFTTSTEERDPRENRLQNEKSSTFALHLIPAPLKKSCTPLFRHPDGGLKALPFLSPSWTLSTCPPRRPVLTGHAGSPDGCRAHFGSPWLGTYSQPRWNCRVRIGCQSISTIAQGYDIDKVKCPMCGLFR